ncbi:hypothetical protein FNV43_RR07302 [Rhamnella rubrinervis]|uniref:Cytochrome P450 n=1 Tax=Rhamnella rubrinervis TaxID=2594499 RepID=A0A8K0HFH3_9ROSA|nr:hypothetical protein FNV43_RR07302 [Rhamnella rubrinervis]
MNAKGDAGEDHEPRKEDLVDVLLRLQKSGSLEFPISTDNIKAEACKIDGYEIPLKTKVIVNAWAIGRDPGYWDDAESFVPERFDGSSVDYKGTSFEFIPFGAGRRMCPGIAFGVANVELPLANLLYHFDWELPGGMNSKNLDMTEAFGATVGMKNNLF